MTGKEKLKQTNKTVVQPQKFHFFTLKPRDGTIVVPKGSPPP